MINLTQKKRLFTALIVIIRKKLKFNTPEKVLEYFKNLNYEYFTDEILKFKSYDLEKKNYDTIILKNSNTSLIIEDILHKSTSLTNINAPKEYDQILNNKFISNRIKRDILNNLNKVINFKEGNRNVVIISDKYENVLLNEIVSIFSLFDIITKNKNRYNLKVYLSDEKKLINENIFFLDGDNINSGSTYPGINITLWRKEEIHKVLIHEIVHYLKIDMYDFQDKFKVLYKDINIEGDICNPNEAYTEFVALLIFTFWKFKKNKAKNIKSFFDKMLLIELGWSFFQIAKIINFFKCYNSYQSLFTDKCKFFQKTNVLSYFILKCYFLKNIKNTIECINFETFKQTEFLTDKLLKTVNLSEQEFTNIINWCIKYLNKSKYKFNNLTLRMTCID